MPNDYTVACQSDTARWVPCESSHAWCRSTDLCGLVWLGVCVCGGMLGPLLCWLVGLIGLVCGGLCMWWHTRCSPAYESPGGVAHALIRGAPGIHWLLYFCASLCEDWLTKWVVGAGFEWLFWLVWCVPCEDSLTKRVVGSTGGIARLAGST